MKRTDLWSEIRVIKVMIKIPMSEIRKNRGSGGLRQDILGAINM